jgi:hypothetical protein
MMRALTTNPERTKRNPVPAQAVAGLIGTASVSVARSADYLTPADPAAVEGASGDVRRCEPPAFNSNPGDWLSPWGVHALDTRAKRIANSTASQGTPPTRDAGANGDRRKAIVGVTAGETAPNSCSEQTSCSQREPRSGEQQRNTMGVTAGRDPQPYSRCRDASPGPGPDGRAIQTPPPQGRIARRRPGPPHEFTGSPA